MRQGSILLMLIFIHALHLFGQRMDIKVRADLYAGALTAGDQSALFQNKFRVVVGAKELGQSDIPVRHGMHAELQYTMFGTQMSETVSATRLKAHYFTIPVLYRRQVSHGLTVMAGPQAGLLMRTKIESERSQFTKPEMPKWDAFLVLGMEYDLTSGVRIALRYQQGLLEAENETTEDWHNKGMELKVSYRVDSGRKGLLNRFFQKKSATQKFSQPLNEKCRP